MCKVWGHKSESKKPGSVTYNTDREIEVSNVFLIYLSYNGEEIYQLKQAFEFSEPYGEIQPAKLTNHGANTSEECYRM